MDIKITPSILKGYIKSPPSKSVLHRLIICAALSKGTSEIMGLSQSDDIKATLNAVSLLGAEISYGKDTIIINGINNNRKINNSIYINCKESGSTLRFLIPIIAALDISATFFGEGRLPSRPITTYIEILNKHGVITNLKDGLPLIIKGKLTSGNFYVPANVSSQYITGLLFALPLLKENSKIILTTDIESRPYIKMTINILKMFGITIKETDYGFFIKGNCEYKACKCICEGDWSNTAFFLSSSFLNKEGKITCKNLNYISNQGDKYIIDILKRFGLDIKIERNSVTSKYNKLNNNDIKIDVKDIPDLVPVICILASVYKGTTHMYNAYRLKLKESDRILSIENVLKKMNINVQTTNNTITIYGNNIIKPAIIDTFNDHRIAMMSLILSSYASKSSIIKNIECINKSFPDFLDKFKQLGGQFDVINMG